MYDGEAIQKLKYNYDCFCYINTIDVHRSSRNLDSTPSTLIKDYERDLGQSWQDVNYIEQSPI